MYQRKKFLYNLKRFCFLPFFILLVSAPYLRSYEEPLLMMPVLQGYPQEDFVYVYKEQDKHFIPFYQFSYLIGISVTEDNASRIAGFLQDKRSDFKIDFAKASASYGGKKVAFHHENFLQIDGQIAFSADFYERLFPLNIKVEELDMLLIITAPDKLPNTLKEDAKRKRETHGVREPVKDLWRDYEFDSRLWAPPVVDIVLQENLNIFNYDRGTKNTDHSESYSVNIAALAAGLDTNLYLYGNRRDDFEPQVRFTAGRTFLYDESPFLAPASFSLGDITGIGSSYFAQNTSGRGIVASSFKNYVTSADKTITLSGALQDGWEVELYLNSQLIGFRQGAAAGRYQFASVPVTYGLNTFKLVFYGPYGEIRTEEKRYYSGSSPVKKGEFGYTLNAYQPNRYLFEGNEPFVADSSVPVLDLVSYYGVADNFTAMAGFTSTQDIVDIKKSRQFAMAGGQFLFKGASLQYNFEGDLDNGEIGHHAEVQGNVYIGDIFARYEYYNEINSPLAFIDGRYAKDLAEIRLTGVIKPVLGTPYYISATRIEDQDGNTNETLSTRLSRQFFKHYNVSLENLWQSNAWYGNGRTNDVSLLAQANFGRAGFYTGATYRTYPQSKLAEMNAKIDYRWDRYTYFAAQYRHDRTQEGGAASVFSKDTFSLLGSRLFSFGGISAEASIATHNNLSFMLRYNLSLGSKPGRIEVFKDAKSKLSEHGALVFHAHDEDGNPVKNVLVSVNSVLEPVRTDEQGDAVLTDILPYEKMTVNVDLSEVEDVTLTHFKDHYKYVLRPGTVRGIHAPFLRKGGIEGMLKHDIEDHYLLGYEIKVFDREGDFVKGAFTDHNGMFVLDELPFGVYRLDISKDGQEVASFTDIKVDRLDVYFEAAVTAPAPRRIAWFEEEEPVRDNGPIQTLKNIADFYFNSLSVRGEHKEVIKEKAAEIKKLPYTRVVVIGHTDSTGSYEVNKRISKNRARAVADVLIAEGVDADKTEVYGEAYDQPAADNDTPEGRKKNRRTDVLVY